MKDNRREFIKKSSALTALSLTGIGTAGTAFSIGYMNALLERVNAES